MNKMILVAVLATALAPGAARSQELRPGTWTGNLMLDQGVQVAVEFHVLSEDAPPTATMNAVGRPAEALDDLREDGEAILFTWGGFSCVVSLKSSTTLEGQCGTSDGTRGRLTLNAPDEAPAADEDVITLDDLREAKVATVFDGIRLLRPRWLRARGRQRMTREAEVVVYFDNQRMGGIELLQSLNPELVLEIRYYNAPDATMKFGTNNDGGVIAVKRRRG